MKFPSAWTESNASTKVAAAANQVSARINMSSEVAGKGNCPNCKKPMERVWTGNLPLWACQACRITLPVANGSQE